MLQKRMNEDSQDNPDATLCLEKDDVLRQAYYKYAREDGHRPENYRVLKVLYEIFEGREATTGNASAVRRLG